MASAVIAGTEETEGVKMGKVKCPYGIKEECGDTPWQELIGPVFGIGCDDCFKRFVVEKLKGPQYSPHIEGKK